MAFSKITPELLDKLHTPGSKLSKEEGGILKAVEKRANYELTSLAKQANSTTASTTRIPAEYKSSLGYVKASIKEKDGQVVYNKNNTPDNDSIIRLQRQREEMAQNIRLSRVNENVRRVGGEVRSKAEEMGKEIQILRLQMSLQQDKEMKLKDTANRALDRRNNLHSEVLDAEKYLEKYRTQIREYEDKIKDLKDKILSESKTNLDLQAEIDKATQNLKDSEKEMEILVAEIEDAKSTIQSLDEKIQATIPERFAKFNTLNEAYTETSKKIEEFIETIDKQKQIDRYQFSKALGAIETIITLYKELCESKLKGEKENFVDDYLGGLVTESKKKYRKGEKKHRRGGRVGLLLGLKNKFISLSTPKIKHVEKASSPKLETQEETSDTKPIQDKQQIPQVEPQTSQDKSKTLQDVLLQDGLKVEQEIGQAEIQTLQDDSTVARIGDTIQEMPAKTQTPQEEFLQMGGGRLESEKWVTVGTPEEKIKTVKQLDFQEALKAVRLINTLIKEGDLNIAKIAIDKFKQDFEIENKIATDGKQDHFTQLFENLNTAMENSEAEKMERDGQVKLAQQQEEETIKLLKQQQEQISALQDSLSILNNSTLSEKTNPNPQQVTTINSESVPNLLLDNLPEIGDKNFINSQIEQVRNSPELVDSSLVTDFLVEELGQSQGSVQGDPQDEVSLSSDQVPDLNISDLLASTEGSIQPIKSNETPTPNADEHPPFKIDPAKKAGSPEVIQKNSLNYGDLQSEYGDIRYREVNKKDLAQRVDSYFAPIMKDWTSTSPNTGWNKRMVQGTNDATIPIPTGEVVEEGEKKIEEVNTGKVGLNPGVIEPDDTLRPKNFKQVEEKEEEKIELNPEQIKDIQSAKDAILKISNSNLEQFTEDYTSFVMTVLLEIQIGTDNLESVKNAVDILNNIKNRVEKSDKIAKFNKFENGKNTVIKSIEKVIEILQTRANEWNNKKDNPKREGLEKEGSPERSTNDTEIGTSKKQETKQKPPADKTENKNPKTKNKGEGVKTFSETFNGPIERFAKGVVDLAFTELGPPAQEYIENKLVARLRKLFEN